MCAFIYLNHMMITATLIMKKTASMLIAIDNKWWNKVMPQMLTNWLLYGAICVQQHSNKNYSGYNKATCEFWSIIGADLLCSGILDREEESIYVEFVNHYVNKPSEPWPNSLLHHLKSKCQWVSRKYKPRQRILK